LTKELGNLVLVLFFIVIYESFSSYNFLCFRFPDKEAGQFPMAYVVRKAGSNLSAGAVMDFVAGQVRLMRKEELCY
jgi:hypothetical protein